MTTKQLGQYFTVSEDLQNTVTSLILNNPEIILEPSFGKGHLVTKVLESFPNTKIIGYEIDKDLSPVIQHKNITVTYSDFLQDTDHTNSESYRTNTRSYRTIIGNPPYVKTSSGNLYIKFIEKCMGLLKESGELIFIVPSTFLKATSARNIVQNMISMGSFTHIYFPNKEKLFHGANIDVMIFRYQKGLISNRIKINGRDMYSIFSDGIITFHDSPTLYSTKIRDLFKVYVGLVSGKESVFRRDIGNVDILCDKNVIGKYILITEFPSSDNNINKYMLEHKGELQSRKIRKFTEGNWWEWGALRNVKTIKENIGRPCIYVNNITRKGEVAFKGRVQLFGGKLLCLIPKSLNTDLDKVVDFLNSDVFKKNYTYSNRFKIGHRQLCNAGIF
jgi:adenine-specific DNA-methyltransferase